MGKFNKILATAVITTCSAFAFAGCTEGKDLSITIVDPTFGDITSSVDKAEAGSEVTLSFTASTGYRLKHYLVDGEILTGDVFTMPKKDVSITAVVEPIPYTITYNLDGGTNASANPSEYNIESSTIIFQAPTKNGYTFLGWYDNADFTGDAVVTASGSDLVNVELFAKWQINTYTIIYHNNGGVEASGNPSEYNVTTSTIVFANPTRDNYTFLGWYDNADFEGNAITNIATGSTGNMELYAKWTPTPYTITYNLNDGINAETNPSGYNVTSETINFEEPTKHGYTFLGWYNNADFNGNAVETIPTGSSGNVELYAKWELTTYTITYYDRFYSNSTDNYNITTDTFDLPVHSQTAYEFLGWYDNNGYDGQPITSIPKGSTGNMTLYAKYEPIVYTITYHLDGGVNDTNNPSTHTVKEWGNIEFYSPTKPGYVFMGWYEDVNFNQKFSWKGQHHRAQNYDLYAKWSVAVIINDQGIITGISNDAKNDYFSVPSTIGGKTFTSIAKDVFKNNTHLTSIDLSNVTLIEDEAFLGCNNLTEVILSGEAKTIGNNAFKGCTSLTSIDLGSTTSIGENIFEGCSNLESINFGNVATINNKLSSTTLSDLTTINFGNATSIGNKVFESWDGVNWYLTSIDFGKVTSIGEYAFYNCDRLTSIDLSNVTSLGEGAFDFCSGLINVTLSENLTSIPKKAFMDCKSLEYIDLKNVTEVGEAAFVQCENLASIDLSKVTTLGIEAFSHCFKLASITLSDELTAIPSHAFRGAAITTIDLKNVTTIGEIAFIGCSNLNSIDLRKIRTIDDSAFKNCTSLTSLELNNIETIGEEAFIGCTSLEYVGLSEWIDVIEAGTFKQSSIKRINLGTIKEIGESAFEGCEQLISVTSAGRYGKIETVGANAFKGCINLKDITLTKAIEIGESAFEGCANLQSILAILDIEKIGANAFKGCASIVDITINKPVPTLGEGWIDGCTGLEVIYVPEAEVENYKAALGSAYEQLITAIDWEINF